jgi:ribosomal protein S8
MNKSACNFISQLNFGYKNSLKYILVKPTKFIFKLIQFLYKENFIQGYKYVVQKGHLRICIFLNIFDESVTYSSNQAQLDVGSRQISYIRAIRQVKLISKPSKIIFIKAKDLVYYNRHSYIQYTVITTSKGLMFTNDALKLGIGGRLLFEILV